MAERFSIDEAYGKAAPKTFSVDEAYGRSRPQLPPDEMAMAQDVLAPGRNEGDSAAQNIRQLGQGVVEGFTGLPGYAADLALSGREFIRRQLGLPDIPTPGTQILRANTSDKYQRAARNTFGLPDNGPPQTEHQRLARKGGMFIGGSAPFGVGALALAPEAFVGSEVGRLADQKAPGITGGYGEFVGGVFGPGVRPAIGAAGRLPGAVRRLSERADRENIAPSNNALRAESDAAFEALRNSDVIVKPESVNRLAQSVRGFLAKQGWSPRVQKGITDFLDELDDTVRGGNVTYQGLVNLRQIAQDIGSGQVPPRQAFMSSKIVEHIDDFLDDLPNRPNEVLTGNPARVRETLLQANSTWSRYKKSSALDKAIQDGLDNAGPHQGYVEGAIATQLKKLLRKGKNGRNIAGLSGPEQEALRRIVHGDNIQNVLRFVGKFSPESVIPAIFEGLGAASAIISANPAAGASALGAMASGFLARRASQARFFSQMGGLSERLRSGAPAAPGRPLPPPLDEPPLSPSPQGPQGGPIVPGGQPEPPIMPGPGQLPPPSRGGYSLSTRSADLPPELARTTNTGDMRHFAIVRDGKRVGEVEGGLTDNGKTYFIGNIRVDGGPGTIPAGQLRQIVAQLRSSLPSSVTKITGGLREAGTTDFNVGRLDRAPPPAQVPRTFSVARAQEGAAQRSTQLAAETDAINRRLAAFEKEHSKTAEGAKWEISTDLSGISPDVSPGSRSFSIKRDGKVVGHISGVSHNGTYLIKDMEVMGGPNSAGPTAMNHIRRLLRVAMPNLRLVTGNRVSGARGAARRPAYAAVKVSGPQQSE